ncbi:hypothetical protein CEQ90_00315 [Lewinellaceae bacterium SD302]|nr:hypothetical protein CEQ90_00315 [Lewinellaceae bacterium SD302]
MRFSLVLLLTLLVISSTSAAGFGDRFKDWLPDFISEWWWPETEEVAGSSIVDEELYALPGAEEWLRLPTAAENNFQFHWPLASIDPGSDEDRFIRAKANTLVYQDEHDFLPLSGGTPVRLIFGERGYPSYFSNVLQAYSPVTSLEYDPDRDRDLIPLARPEVANVLYARALDFDAVVKPWLMDFAELPVVLVLEGNPATLPAIPPQWTVIQALENDPFSQIAAATLLFNTPDQDDRLLSYRTPAAENFDPIQLEKVDYHINRAIRRRATPGAQLLVTKGGHIIYQKTYGHHTYKKEQEVFTSDQYDLASVTKAASTSLAVMLAYEDGKIDLKKQVRDYLPKLKRRAAGRYTIEQLLTHQTGMQANLPLSKYLGKKYVSDEFKGDFTIQLSEDRWLDEAVPEEIIDDLKYVDHTRRRIYRYSDVNYVLLQLIIERQYNRSIADFLAERVYVPLGLQRLGYQPTEQFAPEQIVPTSRDYWMRGGVIRGYVHDEGAALLGGVAGHAGLFATATDLAQLFQLLLNKGTYNGVRVFEEETVELFTTRSRYNYRALGFDRLAGGYNNVIRAGASEATFGHTGFSGTCVWADPDNDLVFVLLTNRIHPDPNNKRLAKLGTRARVHKQVYQSFLPVSVK